MPNWFWIFIILAGGFFVLKMTYSLRIALVLPITGGALYVSTSRVRIEAFMDAVPVVFCYLFPDLIKIQF